jgi:hypothetical protein
MRRDWTDLRVLLFVLSAGLSEALSTALGTSAWRNLFFGQYAGGNHELGGRGIGTFSGHLHNGFTVHAWQVAD